MDKLQKYFARSQTQKSMHLWVYDYTLMNFYNYRQTNHLFLKSEQSFLLGSDQGWPGGSTRNQKDRNCLYLHRVIEYIIVHMNVFVKTYQAVHTASVHFNPCKYKISCGRIYLPPQYILYLFFLFSYIISVYLFVFLWALHTQSYISPNHMDSWCILIERTIKF